MQALFGGNPFGSPLGQRIDKATDGELASEDWALNIEICDIINETEDGPKEAMRALRKKMQANTGKNYKVILYALTVLETCVKNCGKRFHAQVANKDFLQELVRIIGPKNDPPTIVQERILGLIQAWADAFRGSADFKEVEKIYDELRAKGVEFPMTDLDSLAPIHTPGRSSGRLGEQASGLAAGGVGGPAAAGRQASNSEVASAAMAQQQQQIPLFAGAAGGGLVPSVTPTAEQLAKLRSELDVVQENCRIFSELLNDLSTGTAAATAAGGSQPTAAMMASNSGPTAHSCGDAELAHELNHACRQMQQRILELIECVSGGEVTEVLLQANDELNNLFLRYERHERYRSSRAAGAAALASADARVPPAAVALAAGGGGPSASTSLGPSTATAADFSAHLATMSVHESSVSATLSQLGRTPAASASAAAAAAATAGVTSGDRPGDDDFDMFAASRQSFEQSRAEQRNASFAYNDQQQRTHAAGLGPVLSARHTPYTPSAPPPATAPSVDDMLSSDFNQFLLERVRAQDGLPDVPPSVAVGADAAALRGRQMQKDEETEKALFSL